MTNKEIAIAFSMGDFEKIYDYLDENANWIIVETDNFIGKQAITANCKQVENYFRTVTTNFETSNLLEENNMVVVTGSAEFSKEGIQLSFISACDVYEFNDKNLIQKITSYCIEKG